jgi:hypothetical protein
MSVDTKLYLNTRWGIDDIAIIIKRTQDTKLEIESNHSFAPGYFTFKLPDIGRMIQVHSYVQTPIGTVTLLSMAANEQGHKILKDIAEVIGGLFMDNDCDGKCELITGKLSDDDKLPYFIKYAVINDGIKPDNITGLLDSMSAWYDRCDDENKPPILKMRDRGIGI